MIHYQLLALPDFNVSQLEQYLPLVIPQARTLFLEQTQGKDFSLAIAAYENNILVGLAFGEASLTIEQGFIRSLFVLENMRNQGIATCLVKHLMGEFHKKGISFIQLLVNTYEPSFLYLKKILEKLHWKPPQVVVDRYHFYAPTFRPEWYLANIPVLHKNLKISPWQYLNQKHLDFIKKMIKQSPIMEDVSPFDDPLPIDMGNSLVLKKKNEIVGWMITHRYDKDTIRYSALYVDRELRGHGPAICLLKEAIRRQKASAINNAFTEINYNRTPVYWRQFVRKRLAPNATSKDSLLNFFYTG